MFRHATFVALALAAAPASASTLDQAKDLCIKATDRIIEFECLALVERNKTACVRTKSKRACEVMVRYISPADQYSRCSDVARQGGDEAWCTTLMRRRKHDCDDQTWASEMDCKYTVQALEKLDQYVLEQATLASSSGSSTSGTGSEEEVRPDRSSLADQLTARRTNLRSAEDDTPSDGYRRTFSAMSMGTEQELSGVVVMLSKRNRGKLGTVSFDGQTIMDITTDMEIRQDADSGKYLYTIELITHPTEVTREDEWEARKRAFGTVVELIDAKRLETTSRNGLDIEIFPAVASDMSLVGSKVSSSGKQATVGVPTSDIGTGSRAGALIEAAPWFNASRGTELTSADRDLESAQRVYAYLASIHAKLTELSEEFGSLGVAGRKRKGLTDPEVKNSWGLLPRTAPREMLKLLESDDKFAVTRQLRELATDDHSRAALEYIMSGGALSGHANISDATIGGQPSMLFEFRDASDIPADLAAKFGLTSREQDEETIRSEAMTDPSDIDASRSDAQRSLLDAIRGGR